MTDTESKNLKIQNISTDSCALSQPPSVVKLGHGSGGRMTDQLIRNVFQPNIGNLILNQQEDAAQVELPQLDQLQHNLLFTTDSYVVNPIFFPGGDIGSLAVHGTINDLCMRGATPLYLSAAFILEEGFSFEELRKITESMRVACAEANVQIITADTKVVNKGCGDKLYITTSGIGISFDKPLPSIYRARVGDSIICSGDLGRHGMAIMASRENLQFDSEIESDSAPLNVMAKNLSRLGCKLHAMRDITRGGLASVLTEVAEAAAVGIEIQESKLNVPEQVGAACELLGLDPLYVACEGRMIAIVDSTAEEQALQIMRDSPYGEKSALIGRTTSEHGGRVFLKSEFGGRRIIDKLSGEQLPRIC